MKIIYPAPVSLLFLLFLFTVLLSNAALASQAIPVTTSIKGLDDDAGRRIYRDGMLANGQPLTAIVAGDVPLLGTQFSCESCHGRSGMGAAEGDFIVPAISGPILFNPSPQPKRSAYDTKSLARALRDGVNPSGRKLDSLMPRFKLSNKEISSLASYLKGLSVGTSPGVNDKVIRFATVMTDTEDQQVKDAVLNVLHTFVDEKNRQTRLESQRPDRGASPESRLPTVFRKWVLDVWIIKGEASSWRSQLEEYYKQKPVFALLGGISLDNWKPVGEFCEANEIPCLFPSTNLPGTAKDNFYSVHFSQGVELEAKLIAGHLKTRNFKSVIQIHCNKLSNAAAIALITQLNTSGIKVRDLAFNCQQPLPTERLAKQFASNPAAAIMLWLDQKQLKPLSKILPDERVYLSSTLLKGDIEKKFPLLPISAYVAHPFNLPGKRDSALMRFKVWARTRKIAVDYPRLQSEAFYACLVATDAISHLGRFFIRDFVLDMLDHAQPMTAYLPIHPRPTIGPGQRYLSKGGYILALKHGKILTKNAAWLSP